VYKQVYKSKPTRKRRKKVKDNKLAFTQGFMERLEADKVRQKFWDTKVNGLMVEVMPSGSKIFRFRRTIKGKIETSTIGPYPSISLEEARDEAVRLSAKLVDGASFINNRQAARDELTLEGLFDLYFNLHVEGACETADELRKESKRYWSRLLPLKLSAISSLDIQEQKARLAKGEKGKTHKHRSNKALDLVKAAFAWGVLNAGVKENPAKGVKNFTTQSRERIIAPEEYEPLMRAIACYPDKRIRDFFFMCLYTGARSGKVMSMKWSDIDFTLERWLIGKDKNKDSNHVPLSEAALSILRARYKERGAIQWVFPGGQVHQPTTNHLTEPKSAWKKILKWASGEVPNITDLRIHDLRRSLGSYMAMAGENTATIQKVLGHKSLQAASRYQRVNNTAAQDATNKAVNLMSIMANSSQQDKTKNKESIS
jgi:integrase